MAKADKQAKNLIYGALSFVKFKDIDDFNEMPLDSVHERLQNLHKKFIGFKKAIPQTKNNEVLKTKVLDNTGDLFNQLGYTSKERYKEEKDALKKRQINLTTQN